MNKKEQFLRELNQAFANNETEYILSQVTKDIRWDILGEDPIEGKENVRKALQKMESDTPFELTINNIITHGSMAAVDGIMTAVGNRSWGFCDIYEFKGFKNLKVKTITSYVVELTPKPTTVGE